MSGEANIGSGSFQYYPNTTFSEVEIAMRRNEHNAAKKSDKVVIKLINGGVSQNFMKNHLRKDIEAGLVYDTNNDGKVNVFSNKNKRELEKEIAEVFKNHGYESEFSKMLSYVPEKSSNGNGMYEITYGEYERLVRAAGYDFVKSREPEMVSLEAAPINPKGHVNPEQKEKFLPGEADIPFEKACEIRFENNESLKGKTDEERYNLTYRHVMDLKEDIYLVKRPIYEEKRTGVLRFLGIGKKVKVEVPQTPEELEKQQQKLKELEEQLDLAQRDETYLQAKNKKYWFETHATTSLKDKDGNVIKSYPSYTEATCKDENGNLKRVLRVSTYDSDKLKYNHKYYPIAVQKVNDGFVGLERWAVVPDLEHELVGITETK